VPELGSPLVSRRRLAAELRRLREERSLTGEDVAESLGWSTSKISRIETARIGIKRTDLARLLALYEVPTEFRAELIDLTANTRSRGWWNAYTGYVPERFASYLVLESQAESLAAWSPETVPGLLQTQGYAQAAIASHMAAIAAISPTEIEQRVQARLHRQQILTSENPTMVRCVLDESVLLRRKQDAQVMRGQLKHLIDLAQLANVTIRVLPLDSEHPIGTGAFILLAFPPNPGIGPAPDIVYLEQLTGSALYIDEAAETHQYRLGFARLEAESLDPAASCKLIARILREHWSR
jgi:transcriptional regulator with XRE-family HTH domain